MKDTKKKGCICERRDKGLHKLCAENGGLNGGLRYVEDG